jgi:putative DNA primase/helicase
MEVKNSELIKTMKLESFVFDTAPPYPAGVDVAKLLAEIEAVIKKHVVLSDEAAAALAVWVLHTYTFELRDAVAYVAIESPEKRCGKTTLISILAAMAHKPLIASNITVGALFRAIDVCRPTLFIDEADTFLAGNGAMRGIINSGNTWRTAYVLRLARSRRSSAECGVGEGTKHRTSIRRRG